MPYINMRDIKQGIGMIESVRKNFENYIKQEVKMAKLSRETQAMVGHLPDSVFKQIVSDKNLKNCPVEVNDVSNAWLQITR